MPAQMVESPKHGGKKSPSAHSSRSVSPFPSTPTPLYDPSPLPPDRWTDKMLHLWKEAVEASKNSHTKLCSLDDLASEDTDMQLTSPRSIEACMHLGIDLSELAYRPLEAFQEKGLSNDLQQIKFERYEHNRKDKIQKLQAERTKIIAEKEEEETKANERDLNNSKHKGTTDINEKERQAMEMMRKRQQRELEKMAKFEAQRQQLAAETQGRIEAENRAEEQKRLEKARKEKEWQAEMRRRELQKLKEEETIDKKTKQLAAERYMKEQQQLAGEQANLRLHHRQSMRKEQVRIAKQEEYRRQMEKIQEAQREALRQKQEEMQQKDKERQKLMEEHNKDRVRQHMEACKLAETRHAAAVANFYELMKKKEEEYRRKQEVVNGKHNNGTSLSSLWLETGYDGDVLCRQELKIKLKKQEEKHKIAEMEKKRREEMKGQQRLEVIKEAQAEREKRIQVSPNDSTTHCHNLQRCTDYFISSFASCSLQPGPNLESGFPHNTPAYPYRLSLPIHFVGGGERIHKFKKTSWRPTQQPQSRVASARRSYSFHAHLISHPVQASKMPLCICHPSCPFPPKRILCPFMHVHIFFIYRYFPNSFKYQPCRNDLSYHCPEWIYLRQFWKDNL